MDIALHLGVHKTATTYLQTVLASSLDCLHATDVDYVPLDEIRAQITKRMPRPGLNLSSGVRGVLERHGEHRRLILSDENLPGGSREIIDRTYYPMARKRLGRLMKALSGHHVEIFLAVRSYDAFVSSMYCECVRHGAFLTPSEYLSSIDVERLNWRDLVATACELVGEQRVTIWRFEDFASAENEVLTAIAGGASIAWDSARSTIRTSFSQRAVDALSALVPLLHRNEIASLVEAVADAVPKSGGNPAFRAFDEDTASALRSRYDDDLAEISRDFPRMRQIRPSTATSPFPTKRARWLRFERRSTHA